MISLVGTTLSFTGTSIHVGTSGGALTGVGIGQPSVLTTVYGPVRSVNVDSFYVLNLSVFTDF